MYREPISRPETNGYIENGFQNNDMMLPPWEDETGTNGFKICFLHGRIVNNIEPEACTNKENFEKVKCGPEGLFSRKTANSCNT